MPKPRRTLAAALVIGASAIALTGCLPLPPALPEAPPAVTAVPNPSAAPEPATGDFPYTVDDGLGDTWSFDVTNVIADPPMESGEAEAGTFFVGVVVSAEHVEGDVDFISCFDIFITGDDGQTYDWRDTIDVTAENDVYYADDTAFTDAVAAVQLPEGVEPDQVILRSTYGHPEVPDTVIDVN
ncbi:hypothetical protein [Agrococcus sp. KRD186]|uniref:hypothetical protein n=1 Tax=Agrococcus sp. KRD186 TaxID=2729730 RepID=UPI0019D2A3A9|nr:hypothetical protein [Agrococcus sp. KRD186]